MSAKEKDIIQRMPTLVKKAKKKSTNDDGLSRPTVDTCGEEVKERVKHESASRILGGKLPTEKEQLCQFKLTLKHDCAKN